MLSRAIMIVRRFAKSAQRQLAVGTTKALLLGLVLADTHSAEGLSIYAEYRPAGFDPYDDTELLPGVVLVPGSDKPGTDFDRDAEAQHYVDAGFVVIHFDPDGRGKSTGHGTYTTEDYNGFLHQDGLREVLQYLYDLPETDDDNIALRRYLLELAEMPMLP